MTKIHEPINPSVSIRLSMIVLSPNKKDLTSVLSTFSNFKFLSNRFVNKNDYRYRIRTKNVW